jgi:hypothetical protein
MERWQQHVTEVHAKRGDVVIFCEACARALSHGRFVLPLIHFAPDSLTYSVLLAGRVVALHLFVHYASVVPCVCTRKDIHVRTIERKGPCIY